MTIKEIAAIAGVSASTISKIINGKDKDINPNTREHVLKIVKEYNYRPYASIKNTLNAKTFCIGILLKNAIDAGTAINGIMEGAQKQGYSVIILSSSQDCTEELKNISLLCQKQVDGVIWEPVNEDSLEFKQHFEKAGIEILYINSSIPDAYQIDFRKLGRSATEHLLNLGHKQIGILVKPDSFESDLFLEGYKECLFQAAIPFSENLVFDLTAKKLQTQTALRNVTGIVSSHYEDSTELFSLLMDMKIQIPYELSLLSLKSDSLQNIRYPNLSYIEIPYYDFGRYAAEQLISKIEQKETGAPLFAPETRLQSSATVDIPYTNQKAKVITIGSINIDTILNVEYFPSSGTTINTNVCSTYAGGKASNQAVGLAQLGHYATVIGKIGNDRDGDFICTCLNQYGVDTSGITHNYEDVTGKAYIHVQKDGDSIISIFSGANHSLSPEEVYDMSYLFDNCSYCLMQTEIPSSALIAAAEIARQRGITTVLKPSACAALDDALISKTDILVPNKMEINAICPQEGDYSRQADYFLSRGVTHVIITLGSEGCYYKSKNRELSIPAADFPSLDNTGASDAFISALVSYLLYGYPMEKALQIATYAAGFCISRHGVIPSLIDKEALEIYINTVNPALLNRLS